MRKLVYLDDFWLSFCTLSRSSSIERYRSKEGRSRKASRGRIERTHSFASSNQRRRVIEEYQPLYSRTKRIYGSNYLERDYSGWPLKFKRRHKGEELEMVDEYFEEN